MRTNWRRVIDDLDGVGVTLRSQADRAEVSLGTIYYWRQGGEPRHYNGQRLLDLYCIRLGHDAPLQTTLVST